MPVVRAEQIASLDELIGWLRSGAGGAQAGAAAVVNGWFSLDPDRYVTALLGAALGTHQPHFELYRLLTTDRRLELHHRVIARCRQEGRRGLTAGAFMLGRFVSTPHPVAFWRGLAVAELSFVLGEWVGYVGYLQLLDEVGERRLRRARRRLETGPPAEIRLTRADAKLFMPLKLACSDLAELAALAAAAPEPATRRLVEMLRQPYGYFYDYELGWSVAELRRLCAAEGVPLPGPGDT